MATQQTKSIVLQGEVKFLSGDRYAGVWKDTTLTLFADSSVEYEVDGVRTEWLINYIL
jgi:hypothetical protein